MHNFQGAAFQIVPFPEYKTLGRRMLPSTIAAADAHLSTGVRPCSPARYPGQFSALTHRAQASGLIQSTQAGLLFDQMISRLRAFSYDNVGAMAGLRNGGLVP